MTEIKQINSTENVHMMENYNNKKFDNCSKNVINKKSGALDIIMIFFGFGEPEKSNEDQTVNTTRACFTILLLGLLFIVFTISCTGFIIMWFTEIYNNSLISKLVLANDTVALKWWQRPPINTYLKIHIFNYTNWERYAKGEDSKLAVEDLGPYTYVEQLERVDLNFSGPNTITYRERKTSHFTPELSSGTPLDDIIVPNVPMLTAAALIEDWFIYRLGLKSIFTSTSAKPLRKLTVDGFLWGYDDELIALSKKYFNNVEIPYEKFGMLITRNGTSTDKFTIDTGEGDLEQLGKILSVNENRKLNVWASEECNRIDGTDGSQFPPHLMNKKDILYVYINTFCRKFPLVYEKEVSVFDGIPAWRYISPSNVFATPSINPENYCFCNTGNCPPSGLYNISACSRDAPIFISFPHFYNGDPELIESIDGIKPDKDKHGTFADIHPRLAFPIDGASRFQINIQVQNKDMLPGAFTEGQILPILWLEVTAGEINDELREMVYHSSFSANAIQMALRYGTLLVTVTSLGLIVAILYFRGKQREELIKTNIQLSTEPINLINDADKVITTTSYSNKEQPLTIKDENINNK